MTEAPVDTDVRGAEGNLSAIPALASGMQEAEFLCFRILDRIYAVSVTEVREVIAPGSITQVPNTPPHVLGVFNRHGRVTAVLDLASFLGTQVENTPKRLVVLEIGDLDAAVPVSDIIGILVVPKSSVEPPLPHLAAGRDYFVGQINKGGQILSVLNGKALLSGGRCDVISRAGR